MKKNNGFDNVKKLNLPNGLTVLILEDKRTDVCAFIHWVKVGYFNEKDSLIGISHFLEHMFFKGSKTRKMEEITDEIKGLGGYINAGTIYDHTYFYTVLPAKNTEKAISILSDLIINPNFPKKEIETEKSVVIEEIKKKLDSPDQLGFERLVETAFSKHRIRRFRMGYEQDIRRLTKKQIESYYKSFYCPNNSIIAVAGKVDSGRVVDHVKKYYGKWKNGRLPAPDSPVEPEQKYPKYRRLKADISRCYQKLGFHIPNVFHDDFYALNFASAILGKGKSCRLFQKLKEDASVVDDVNTSIYADGEIGYFVIESYLDEKKFPKCRKLIIEELRRLMDKPPSEDEMQKVRNIIETNYFADKEDVLGQAYNLAYYESLGDYKLSKDYLLKAISVSPTEISDAVRRYFTLNNLTLLEYVSSKSRSGQTKGTKMKGDLLGEFKRYYADTGSSPLKKGPEKKPYDFPFKWLGDHRTGKVQTKVLPGSLTLIFKKTTGIPMVSTALYYPGGRLDENEKNCGISNLVLRSSFKGTGSMNALQIANSLESLGCSLRGEATADNFGYAFTCLKKNFKDSYSILRDIMYRPSLDEKEIEKEKLSMKAAIARRRDDMFRYPIDLCYRSLFGIHPYGLPRYGTEKSINSITRDEMLKWHGSFFDASKMVVCSVGDIDDEVRDLILEPVKGMAKRPPRSAQILPLAIKRGIKETVERRKKKQSSFAMAFQTPGVSNEDFYPLEVLQNLLAGMGGRLYMEVREKKGLAYTVTAFNISLMRTGAFVIYAATSPHNERKARDIILDEIARIGKRKIEKDEIERARNYTIGANSISLQTNLAQAYEYLRYHFIKGDASEMSIFNERIRSVKEEDIKRVVNKYFDPSNYAIGVIRGE